MIKEDNIKISPYKDSEEALKRAVARKHGVRAEEIASLRIVKRSVDARKKDAVTLVYSVECALRGERLPQPEQPAVQRVRETPGIRPVVVGSGPAGMLCALTLAEAGACPIVLERGLPVKARTEAVEKYFSGGELDVECNVQFGEGGAGTFSDGKLNTGIKDARIRRVFEKFVEAGAPPEIMWQSKPHIGTDRLVSMVVQIRHKIEALGGTYYFGTRLDDIITDSERIKGIIVSENGQKREIPCEKLVLATGHSARDTFSMLNSRGVYMEQKPFSVGARIEHPQTLIDRIQYGSFAGAPALGAADYKLAAKAADGRGVYTFCMCPGGRVVAAASEPESVVTNGMSLYARADRNANSAVLVSVGPGDYGSDHPLAGVEFQRRIERAAYKATDSSRAPAQLLGDFMAGKASADGGSVEPSYRPGVVYGDIGCCLPEFVTSAMREGLAVFGRKLKGFAMPDAVLTAPETRSSSPVRIVRDDTLQSSIKGLYPCGEGAGYAGGITSAAVDGIRCAEQIISEYNYR